MNRMRFSNPVASIGPIVPLFEPNAVTLQGCMVASPHTDARHALILSCQSIPKLGSAFFRKPGVIHDPRHHRPVLLHCRQYLFAHLPEDCLITLGRLGHQIVQRLTHRLYSVRVQTAAMGSMLFRSPGSNSPLQ